MSAQDAARHYGLTFDRRGWAVCPFHQDKHPSMSFRAGRFRCWACNASGDAVDFTARLFGLEPMAAVERVNADFMLGLPLHRQQTPQERTKAARAATKRRELSDTAKAFDALSGAMLDKLTAVFRMAHLALKDCQTPDDLTAAEALSVKWQAAVEYWADCLMSGDMSVQMDIFRDRKGVNALCKQILNSMQTKSCGA